MLLKIDKKIIFKKKHLNFRYDQEEDVKFNKMQIVGRNGSGKTTLLCAIYEGKGLKCNCKKDEVIKVSQFTNLFDSLSIRENIIMHNENWLMAFEHFNDFFPSVKSTVLVKSLSGGQKQILNIVIALSIQSSLYLIDEPFNNLDIARKIKLSKYLSDLDCPIIIIAHGEQLNFCDTTLRISDEVISFEKKITN